MKNLAELLVNGIACNPTVENALCTLISTMSHYPQQKYCNTPDLPNSIVTALKEIGFKVDPMDPRWGCSGLIIHWPEPKQEDKCETFTTYPDYRSINDANSIELKLHSLINSTIKLHPNANIEVVCMMRKNYVEEVAKYIASVIPENIIVHGNTDAGIVSVYTKCVSKKKEEDIESYDELSAHIVPVDAEISALQPDGSVLTRIYRDFSDLHFRKAGLRIARIIELYDCNKNENINIACKVPIENIDKIAEFIKGLYGDEYDIHADKENGVIDIYNYKDNKADKMMEQFKKEQHPAPDSLCKLFHNPNYRKIDDPNIIKMKLLAFIADTEKAHPGMRFSIYAVMKPECLQDVYEYMQNISGDYEVWIDTKYNAISVSNYKSEDRKASEEKTEPKEVTDPIDKIPMPSAILDAEESYRLSTSSVWYVSNKIHDAISTRQTSVTIVGCFMSERVKKELEEKHYKVKKFIKGLTKGGCYPEYEISWDINDLEDNDDEDEEDE